jgi:hypothetical protein
MALTVGVNSWASVAEADTYLGDIANRTAWFDLDDTPADPGEQAKSSLLVTAFRWITSKTTLTISNTSDSIKNAQIEAAYFLLINQSEYESREALIKSGVKSFRYSEASESFDISQMDLPDSVTGLIGGFTTGNVVAKLRSPYDA